MELPEIKNNYSWSHVEDFTTGPRRELTLFIRLYCGDKQGRNVGPVIPVRFGGIVNFDEVKKFFEAAKKSGELLYEELLHFDYDHRQISKPGRLFFRIFIDRSYVEITIQCSNITEAHPRDFASTSNEPITKTTKMK
jgi:hypothetical protein